MGALKNIVFFVICAQIGLSEASFRPPKIFLDEEFAIDSNTDLIIRCEGDETLKWTYPNNTLNGVSYSRITTHDEKLRLKEYKYASILSLHNASFLDVGFYYCHGKDADFDDDDRSAKIYLYVKDEEVLTVITEEIETVFTVAQYSQVILPCRPTSSDIKVKLYKSSSYGNDHEGYYWEKIHLDIPLADGSTAVYDPRKGFILTNHDYEEVYGDVDHVYQCVFSRGPQTQNSTVLLLIQPRTTSISKPEIEDLNSGHTTIGEKLSLKCILKTTSQFSMVWKVPDQDGFKTKRIYQEKVGSMNEKYKYYRLLHIENATKMDEGNYSCLVEDHNNKKNNVTTYVRIFDVGDHFINLTEENKVYNISTKAGEPVQWSINIDAHPVQNLTVQWFDNKNELIDSDGRKDVKYVTNHTKADAFLRINSVSINDLGNYTLVVHNGLEEKDLKLFLTVEDKPSAHIESKDFHFINTISDIRCVAVGYPEPDIAWTFKPCLDDSCDEYQITDYKIHRNGLQNISSIRMTASKSGQLTCFANNSLGYDRVTIGYYVTDVLDGFNLWYSDNLVDESSSSMKCVSIGDSFELYCAASVYNYTNSIEWYHGSQQIVNDDSYTIEMSHTDFSYKSTLMVRNPERNHSGEYYCKTTENSLSNKEANFTLDVLEPQRPMIYDTSLNEDIDMDLPEALQLMCRFRGLPKPTIVWYKDNKEIVLDNRTEMFEGGAILQFRKTVESDEGQYSCKTSNKIGEDARAVNLVFNNKLSDKTTKIIIGCLSFFLLFFVVVLLIKIKKEAKLRDELRKTGLEHFENGQVDSLNPELGIDDQAELLPYDKKWEFPRDKIKLGKQLGSGAFGVVMKAEADGIVVGEETTTVAVKMVKRNADHALIRALASELKIMVHLGKHINVVNLLGACTKNVVKRELLVIVEYCRFGNLQNYLLRHRENFIDQIDMNTGKINYSIGSELLDDRSLSFSSNRSNSQSSKSPALKYVSLKFSKNSEEGGHINKLMADYRGGNPSLVNYSVNTDTTTVMMAPGGDSDDLMSMSNNSTVQPEWRSNYRGDYKGSVKPICTKDLLAWAFQVSRAMEYLASRKVLHGDLAARNILLADNNIVKVCDFGLAKSMYKSGDYKKKGDGPLPVKWMAVESIRDRVFSTQSDVWSFGIVLWEFFSLGRTPYPGMEADERLYHKLHEGYRMDAPTYATREIYQMMLSCWESMPRNRPSFTLIADQIGYMLEESVKQFYIELNDPYLIMNTNRLEDGQSDYLAMFTPPDFECLSSPQDYINEPAGENNHPNGYMCMKQNQIFSPREADEGVFRFDVAANKAQDGEGAELSPMLHSRSESDNEGSPQIPTTPSSFSNPSYLVLPDITQVADGDILQSTDNYVNMPKNKSVIVSKATDKISQEVPYVNSMTRDWDRVEA